MVVTRLSAINLRSNSFRNITTVLLIFISVTIFQFTIFSSNVSAKNQKTTRVSNCDYNKYACGPMVLEIILKKLGKPQSYEALLAASGTKRFKTTLEGMKRALDAQGARSQYYTASAKDIPILAQNRYLVCHTKRNHFVIITRADASWVYMIDTYLGLREIRVPTAAFSYLWDGVVLAVENGKTNCPIELTAISKSMAEKIIGGEPPCDNVEKKNAAGAGNNPAANTSEPVDTANGNYFSRKTDLAIPGIGIPLILARTYNSQTVSVTDDWTREEGAGTWVIEDGELSGEGDRIHNNGAWSEGTITVDMRTVTLGENYTYEVGQINFRFKGEKDRYYVLLHTNGRLELAKYKNNIQSFPANAVTSLNPLKWNKFQILTSMEGAALRIRVIVNEVQYINYLDNDPLGAGEMVLESYFCHAHYDNISISDKSRSVTYNFDYDDNDKIFGYGWTTFLDCSVRELAGGNVLVTRENGKNDVYTRLSDGSYKPPKGVYDTLAKDITGYTLLLVKQNLSYRFDTSGRLLSVNDRNNNKIQLQYSTVKAQ